MIKEDYVSFEVAQLLKSKEFDVKYDNGYPHVTLQMAIKWLREEHYLWIDIDLLTGYKWTFSIWFMNDPELKMGESLQVISTYNEACESAIRYCLKNLVKK